MFSVITMWNKYSFNVKDFTVHNFIAAVVLQCITNIVQSIGIIEWSHINNGIFQSLKKIANVTGDLNKWTLSLSATPNNIFKRFSYLEVSLLMWQITIVEVSVY